MLDKKGQVELFDITMALFEIGMILMVGFTLYGYFLKPLSENTFFTKKYLSTDLAMLLETIPSANNLAFYYDPTGIQRFSYRIGDDVTVYEDIKPAGKSIETGWQSTPYYRDSLITYLNTGLKTPPGIMILKDASDIRFADKPTPEEPMRSICEEVSSISAIIDIGHGGIDGKNSGFDTGDTAAGQIEAELIRTSAREAGLGKHATTRSLETDQHISMQDRESIIEKSKKTLISLHTGTRTKRAIIWYDWMGRDMARSKAMACKLANRLRGKMIQTQIMPLDLEMQSETDPRQILSYADSGIFLEIGNLIEDPQGTAEITRTAIRELRKTLEEAA